MPAPTTTAALPELPTEPNLQDIAEASTMLARLLLWARLEPVSYDIDRDHLQELLVCLDAFGDVVYQSSFGTLLNYQALYEENGVAAWWAENEHALAYPRD